MELPTTEEMRLTLFNLPEDNTITETQVQTQTMDVMDTLIPMDSHSNNITQEQHQELQVQYSFFYQVYSFMLLNIVPQ
jgi:hypothetical protein